MRAHGRILCGLLAMIACVATSQAHAQKLVHAQRSLYREVLVYETDGERCMCFTRQCRVGRQSCMNMREPDRIVMNYPQLMLSALFVEPAPQSILIVGLGGGTIPRTLERILPQARIDIVEIDAAVIKVAKDYFAFKESDRMRVVESDGRVFVKRALRENRRYDLIMLDAFDHEYIPEHLLTQEFLREVRSLLAEDGLLAANTFSSSRLYDHESTTYASVFPEFFNLKRENRVVLAKLGPVPDADQIKTNSELFEQALSRIGVSTSRLLPLFSSRPDWNPRARVLTDQYSPANLLNRE